MLFDRMIRAARLDSNLYEEVEHDQNATGQAATVVAIVAVCQAIGSAVRVLNAPEAGGPGAAVLGVVLGLVAAFIGWIVWSYVTYWIGTSVFKGVATPGEMLRTIGFAYTPNVLGILAFIPFVGGLAAFIGSIWALVAGIIAIRQGLDLSTGQAVITAIIGWLAVLLLTCLVAAPAALLSGLMA
ncbi:MAG: YIP1 family protein [Chloroflexota bacterium]|nr:YIP1 family protein [Chloroflexota bacterium]